MNNAWHVMTLPETLQSSERSVFDWINQRFALSSADRGSKSQHRCYSLGLKCAPKTQVGCIEITGL